MIVRLEQGAVLHETSPACSAGGEVKPLKYRNRMTLYLYASSAASLKPSKVRTDLISSHPIFFRANISRLRTISTAREVYKFIISSLKILPKRYQRNICHLLRPSFQKNGSDFSNKSIISQAFFSPSKIEHWLVDLGNSFMHSQHHHYNHSWCCCFHIWWKTCPQIALQFGGTRFCLQNVIISSWLFSVEFCHFHHWNCIEKRSSTDYNFVY